ncbi:hypothetical protein ACWEK5_18825 [Rhodococcus koreensis]
MADGTLHADGKIAELKLATRVQLPRSAVADALKQLADEGLINQDENGRSWLPTPPNATSPRPTPPGHSSTPP